MQFEDKVGCGIVIAWIIGGLISLAISVGIVIVAIHFIAKFWVTLKKIRRLQRASFKRPPAKCTECGHEMEYDPIAGWYELTNGKIGGCHSKSGKLFVHHRLDSGKRAHRFAAGGISFASKA